MSELDGHGRPGLTLVGPQSDVVFYADALHGAEAVLVLGCGTGRLALGLASEERRVVGVDASPRMLHHAEERRQALPAEDRAQVRFVTSDLRSLRLADRFGAVVVPHNGLSLLASEQDLLALLATVKHHLAPEGTFAFDVVNAQEIGGWVPVHRRPFAPHLRERQRQSDKDVGGIRRWKVRQLAAAELDSALIREGFVVTERYGDFHGRPFEPADASQIVVAALDTVPVSR
jgi:SAM-dependent methyltransferase